MLGIIAGNSSVGARFGYVVNMRDVWQSVAACEECMEKQISDADFPSTRWAWDDVQCEKCTQWKTNVVNPKLRSAPAYANYPATEIQHEDGKIEPHPLTFYNLSEALNTAHDKFVDREWTEANCRAYLHCGGLNDKIIGEALPIFQWNYGVRILKEGSDEEKNRLSERVTPEVLQDMRKIGFKLIPKPALWDRHCPLAVHVDPPMHLLFLGIGKTLLKKMFIFLRVRRVMGAVNLVCEAKIQSVESMKLAWMRLLPLSEGKMTGWVSENYVSFYKIAPWVLSTVQDWDPVGEKYVDPTTEYTTWTAKQCEMWLKMRDMNWKGKVAELKERVKKDMTKDGGPTPLPEIKGIKTSDLVEVLKAFCRLLSIAMDRDYNEHAIVCLDFAVKLFLTTFER